MFVLAALVVACAGPQPRSGPQKVTTHAWCEAVGMASCRNIGNQCFNGMSGFEQGCLESFVARCTQGRDDTPTQRSYDDLNACVQYTDSRSCEELGRDAGEEVVGTGRYAELCKLRP